MTLNVLERLLLEFDGSVLLVTHDRYFLDKVATAILAFEGQGRVTRYPGNYEMYRTLREQAASSPLSPPGGEGTSHGRRAGARPPPLDAAGAVPQRPLERPRKLSFKEQRELEGMEVVLEAAETRKSDLEARLADPLTYQKDGSSVAALQRELAEVTATVERLYARWQELESLRTPP